MYKIYTIIYYITNYINLLINSYTRNWKICDICNICKSKTAFKNSIPHRSIHTKYVLDVGGASGIVE